MKATFIAARDERPNMVGCRRDRDGTKNKKQLNPYAAATATVAGLWFAMPDGIRRIKHVCRQTAKEIDWFRRHGTH
jgi:hypothetical protein